jgi:serine/threonine protein kinase
LANFQYAAPEQRTRGRDVTSKADIYALGLILNEMFTGDIPSGTGFKTVVSVAPNYAFLDGLIEAMIKQDPEQRPSMAVLRQELANRETQFANQQKIDRLTQEVVSAETLDDPLVRRPITLVNVDYQREELISRLSSSPNPKWIEQFHALSGITSSVRMGPGSVSFRGSVARIACAQPRNAQMQLDYFKDWLMKANQSYAARITIESQEARQKERSERESILAEERKRQELLKRLKW